MLSTVLRIAAAAITLLAFILLFIPYVHSLPAVSELAIGPTAFKQAWHQRRQNQHAFVPAVHTAVLVQLPQHPSTSATLTVAQRQPDEQSHDRSRDEESGTSPDAAPPAPSAGDQPMAPGEEAGAQEPHNDTSLSLTDTAKLAHHQFAVRSKGYAKYAQGQAIIGLAVASSGKRLYSAGRDRTIKCWSWPDGNIIYRTTIPEGIPIQLKLTSDDAVLITAVGDLMVRYRAADDGRLLRSISGRIQHRATSAPLALFQSGNRLAATFLDSTIRVWTVPEGDLQLTLPADATDPWGIAATAGGEHLVVGVDHLIKLYALPQPKPAAQIVVECGPVASRNQLLLNPRGNVLAVTEVVDGIEGIRLRSFPDMTAQRHWPHIAASLCFHPRDVLLTGGIDGTIRCWRLTADEPFATLRTELLAPADSDAASASVTALALAPDGFTLFAGFSDGHLTAWDLKTRRLLGFFQDEQYDPKIDPSLDGIMETR